MTGHTRALALFPLLASLAGPPVFAQPAAVVASVSRGTTPLCSPGDVVVIKAGGVDAVPVAAEGCPAGPTRLEPGDLLRSTSDSVNVMLRCAADVTAMRLPGKFQVLVAPPRGPQDCAINLTAGSVLVTSTGSSQVQAGLATLGTPGTEYSAQVSGSSALQVNVYQGAVSVTTTRGALPVITRGTKTMLRAGQAVESVQLADPDFEMAAGLLAAIDASQVAATGEAEKAKADLTVRYTEALKHPDAASYRVALALSQVKYGLPNAARYQVKRAQELKPPDAETRALTFYANGLVLGALGEATTSKDEMRRATELDPNVAVRATTVLQRQFSGFKDTPTASRTEGRVVLRALEVSARALPASVPAGQAATIVVSVASAGRPVAGASVRIMSGGGAFAASRTTSVSGQTDARGVFTAAWSCAPCAAAYGLDISAEKDGYTSGQASMTVRIGGDLPAAPRPAPSARN